MALGGRPPSRPGADSFIAPDGRSTPESAPAVDVPSLCCSQSPSHRHCPAVVHLPHFFHSSSPAFGPGVRTSASRRSPASPWRSVLNLRPSPMHSVQSCIAPLPLRGPEDAQSVLALIWFGLKSLHARTKTSGITTYFAVARCKGLLPFRSDVHVLLQNLCFRRILFARRIVLHDRSDVFQ